MKVKKVIIENFMAIGHAEIVLADRGLVLVQGDNPDETSSDSNGAGKSSIFDASSWCKYGRTARGEEGDKVVNRTAGKNCRVAEEIEDGPDTYRIARHRKHKVGKNGVTLHKWDPATSDWIDLTKGTDKLTQVVIDQVIGCSYEVFCGAVYAGQERMPDLPGMTDKQLKMLIEEASGATLLENAYQEANKRAVDARKATDTAWQAVGRADAAIASAEADFETAVVRKDRFEEARIESIKSWHVEGINVRDNIKVAEAKLAGMGDKDAIEAGIRKLNAAIAAVDGEIEQDRGNTELAAMAQSNLRDAQSAYSRAEKQFLAHDVALTRLDHQVGCPCETCDRPFSAEDIEPAKKIAAENLAAAKAAQVAAYKALDEASERAKNAAEKRNAYRASMTDLTSTNDKRASLQRLLRNITLQESAIAGLKSDLDLLVRQMRAKKDEPNPYVDDIVKIDMELVKRKEARETAQAAWVETNKAVVIHEAVAKVFSPAGVRAFLLDEVTPFLNDQTAKYLGTLSDGHIQATWTTLVKTAKGELREKFSIEVDNTTGGESFGLISGGEKRKVRIACALALQDLVARRASKPIELFIGDEIDDALDDAGRQRLMDVLEEKARERGSVFIISHSDLKDWVRNQITVRKVGGKATVEEVTA